MKPGNWLISAELTNFGRGVDLAIAVRRFDSDLVSVAQNVLFADYPESALDNMKHPQAFLSMRLKDAQQLMDELWRCGLRPSEGTGSAGSLAATERHLEDMQAIAMGLLRKDGVSV